MSTPAVRLPGGRSADPGEFRKVMGLFPTGVTVVTAGRGERTEAVTASAVASISLDPPLVLVSLRAAGRLPTAIDGAGGFAVNVLAADQERLSALFAARDRPRGVAALERLGGTVGASGHVVLPSAVLSLECRTEHRYPGGDHVLFLGRVLAVHAAEPVKAPLVHHRGAYHRLHHLSD
ncbi:flavin reductase family protein [Actinosynnema sp. NPDC047251]|uniref:Flavin reductase like domain-containing protein n=1 Tax=Saccharothrix espanaensis (strain ATCC 51144 / DSM 44229 / JCM 9112 / NBRC 15066 / NRRL 15764) TaxID=1179773 RepID=K0JU44_SACES|nr:flavin reductase family protein [Saccharothrix espanaensis]CCH29446.1 hypothetical protein BN6_21240 [Saccharothrix espanaensis DSM 44229]